METYKIYYGGQFVETDQVLEVKSPFSKKTIAKTFLASEQDLNKAIDAALAIEKQMAELPTYVRYQALMHIASRIREKKEHFAHIIASEAAKPYRYAIGEVERAIQTFTVAAEEAKRLPYEYITLDWTKPGHGKEGLVKYFPIGLVAGISPFNFPLNLAVHKIAPAIAAGNPIILKPSRHTPLSTLELAKIIDETDLPKGAVSIVPTDRQVGNILVTDPRIKMLSFTGSPAVGWEMKRMAPPQKRVLLELGGNAGIIVSKTADLDLALKKILVGAYAYSGQVCIHAQRVFVHKDIFDKFVQMFIDETKRLKEGDPTDPDTDISSMIEEDAAKRVESWVNEAVDQGAKILYGGTRKFNFFQPTVLTNTNSNMKVWALEIFGPVVLFEQFETFEQAVDMINDSEYGLQAGVFTDSYKEMSYAFNNIVVGGVIINDVPTFRVDHMPYGGVKNSGFGREGLKYSIREQMEPRLLVMPNVHKLG